ncbi:hypothetical protein GY45DRAFT_708517 [Cubamyces sp. BRFM 1775]|nr:hypothetical protein GY45DRAFT_708517 [Cubamyces sp. BRFM 1775]
MKEETLRRIQGSWRSCRQLECHHSLCSPLPCRRIGRRVSMDSLDIGVPAVRTFVPLKVAKFKGSHGLIVIICLSQTPCLSVSSNHR